MLTLEQEAFLGTVKQQLKSGLAKVALSFSASIFVIKIATLAKYETFSRKHFGNPINSIEK